MQSVESLAEKAAFACATVLMIHVWCDGRKDVVTAALSSCSHSVKQYKQADDIRTPSCAGVLA